MQLPALTSLVRPFAFCMGLLREFIFRRAAPTLALGPLMPLLYNYLGRTVRRLDALVLKWERDQLPARPCASRPTRTTPAPRDATPAPKTPGLPTKNGWLLACHPPLGMYSGAVEQLLTDPDTRALLAAAPQAGRLLRPLARMFGLALPEWLRLPKRPRKPPAPKPRKPREDLSDLRPIAIRFIPPKDRARLRRLGLRFKTCP